MLKLVSVSNIPSNEKKFQVSPEWIVLDEALYFAKVMLGLRRLLGETL